MRSLLSRRGCAGFVSLVASLLLLGPEAGRAACNPGSCDAIFDCGFRECVGLTCESFAEDAGTLCRSAAGVCDAAESCNGTSLSCPTNKKKSAASVCRTATTPCDAAEHCDGTSNDCPDDTGATPAVASVAIIASTHRSGGIDLGRDVFVEVTGTNLCSAQFATPVTELTDMQPDTALPTTRMVLDRFYQSPEDLAADFPPGSSYRFDLNDGAIAGTVSFAPGAPDGSLEILGPPTDSRLDGNPTFTLSNHCTNCGLMRLSFENDGLAQFLGSQLFDPLPLDVPTETSYADVVEAPTLLGEGHYEFHAEGIDGSFVSPQFFAGDPSGESFDYLSGTSLRDEVEFTVPEPAAWPGEVAMVTALAACAQRRRR